MSTTSKKPRAELCIRIARSKTDQEGRGAVIAIVPGAVACPIKSIKSGSLLPRSQRPRVSIDRKGRPRDRDRLSDKSAADIVKTYAQRIGLETKTIDRHSLRAGF